MDNELKEGTIRGCRDKGKRNTKTACAIRRHIAKRKGSTRNTGRT